MKTCLLALLVGTALLTGCTKAAAHHASEGHSSEASAPNLMFQYGCPTCHVIPNVPGAAGKIGPSLESLNQRSYLAGTLPNTPENLQLWIMHPQQVRPGTAMPDMGVTELDAGRIAAFIDTN